MTDYLTETQQVEMLREWWRKHGKKVLYGVLIATLCYFSGQWWVKRQNAISSEASIAYEQLLITLMNNDQSGTMIQANSLVSEYPKTPYASLAQFIAAKQAVRSGERDTAQQKLQWIVDHSKQKSIRQIARLRIVSLLQEKDQFKQALKVLDKVDDASFLTMIEEARGDIYLALGKKQEAKKSYEIALQALVSSTIARPILQMKLENLM